MKTTLFCIFLLLSGIISAQTIDNPPFKARSGSISNITRIAVSYTHLDVYKRQGMGKVPAEVGFFAESESVLEMEGKRLVDFLVLRIVSLQKTCLLYTSLQLAIIDYD